MGNCTFFKNRKLKSILKNTTNKKHPLQYDFELCKVVNVRDGDTIVVNAYFNKSVYTFPIRLFEVDTPELKSQDPEIKRKACEAKEYTENRLLNKILKVNILTGKPIPGKENVFYEQSFDRLIGIIYTENGKNFSDELIEKGYGIKYIKK